VDHSWLSAQYFFFLFFSVPPACGRGGDEGLFFLISMKTNPKATLSSSNGPIGKKFYVFIHLIVIGYHIYAGTRPPPLVGPLEPHILQITGVVQAGYPQTTKPRESAFSKYAALRDSLMRGHSFRGIYLTCSLSHPWSSDSSCSFPSRIAVITEATGEDLTSACIQ